MPNSNSKITVVLVHGAWAECASWTQIILPLQKQGLGVVCAPIPLTSLGDDVGALDRVRARIGGDIVLVGHAYAGAVIGAVRNERVKLLVYVAALAPDEGETVADVFYREPLHAQAPKLAPDEGGFIWMPPEGFEHAFAQDAGTSMTVTILLMILFDAIHPPAASTALAFALPLGANRSLVIFGLAVGITATLVLLQRAALWFLNRRSAASAAPTPTAAREPHSSNVIRSMR